MIFFKNHFHQYWNAILSMLIFFNCAIISDIIFFFICMICLDYSYSISVPCSRNTDATYNINSCHWVSRERSCLQPVYSPKGILHEYNRKCDKIRFKEHDCARKLTKFLKWLLTKEISKCDFSCSNGRKFDFPDCSDEYG